MKTYELTYIISPEITSEEAEAKSKEFERILQDKEGVILSQTIPSARTLSYPIEGRSSGFFGIIEFEADPEKLPEIKETLNKDGKLVRYIVIIKKAVKVRKIRRQKPIENIEAEQKPEAKEPAQTKTPATKEKVELKDIEEKLEEILGE